MDGAKSKFGASAQSWDSFRTTVKGAQQRFGPFGRSRTLADQSSKLVDVDAGLESVGLMGMIVIQMAKSVCWRGFWPDFSSGEVTFSTGFAKNVGPWAKNIV